MAREVGGPQPSLEQALDALERTLNHDLLWWRERHGHSESFRIGVEHGLSQAVAHVIQLKFQLGYDDGA